MKSEQLPGSYVWRGIELKRVVRESLEGGGIHDFGFGRTIRRLSDPAVFSGTVGMWRYTVEQQSDGSWVGKIYVGGANNPTPPPYSDPFLALDFAAAWWRAAVDAMPVAGPAPAVDGKLVHPCADGMHDFDMRADDSKEECSRCLWTRGEIAALGNAQPAIATEFA